MSGRVTLVYLKKIIPTSWRHCQASLDVSLSAHIQQLIYKLIVKSTSSELSFSASCIGPLSLLCLYFRFRFRKEKKGKRTSYAAVCSTSAVNMLNECCNMLQMEKFHCMWHLLWICRHDRGMRPRTAVTLWQSIVRPILEYASEFWAGLIPAYLEKDAEKVQM
jgi:hypothetical protein